MRNLPLLARIVIPMLLTAGLGGCTSMALNSLNGIGMCPPEALVNANAFAYAVQTVRPGDDAEFLRGLISERTDRLRMRNGQQLTLKFYRTGHPRCRNMPTNAELTPVLLTDDGRVVALGDAAVRPIFHQAQRVTTLSDQTPRTRISDILMGRF